MNPNIGLLHPYPFQRLQALTANITPRPSALINLAIGEPRHEPPRILTDNIVHGLHALSAYPSTRGDFKVRDAIAQWLTRRFKLPIGLLDPNIHILPTSGSREALFSVVQTQIDLRAPHRPIVIMPNPFYQIYEGAVLLAGAEPYYLNTTATNDFRMDFSQVPPDVLARTQLVFTCSPSNPTGQIMRRLDYAYLLDLAQRYNFLIAADECYSELYDNEDEPPEGLLQTAAALEIRDFAHCVVFHSLSKRSSVPGLRAGFVAGSSDFMRDYLTFRTYQGSAPSLLAQNALIAALSDEQHVVANRARYREKFDAVINILRDTVEVHRPAGGFYLWLRTPIHEEQFAAELFRTQHVLAVPGRYLSRPTPSGDPGENHLRIALVGTLAECREGAARIRTYIQSLPLKELS